MIKKRNKKNVLRNLKIEMINYELYDTILGYEILYDSKNSKYGVKLISKIKWFSTPRKAKEFIYRYLRD